MEDSLNIYPSDVHDPVPPPALTTDLNDALGKALHTFSFSSDGERILVIIPTENKFKVDTITKYMEQRYSSDTRQLLILPTKMGSNAGEQPYGLKSGAVDGALGRINNVMEMLKAQQWNEYLQKEEIGSVLIASIENFIDDEAKVPVDYAIRIIYSSSTGKIEVAVSKGCLVPERFVTEAKKQGFADKEGRHGKVTVGNVIADNNEGVKHDNFHEKLCGRSRYDLIRDI